MVCVALGPRMLVPMLVVVTSLTALWLTTPWRERFVAAQLAERLADANVPKIRATLAALVEMDLAGIDALVGLLDSSNPEVAKRVPPLLQERLDVWRQHGPAYWSPRITALATSLESHISSFRPPARRLAAEIVAEIIPWPVTDDENRSRFLIACDHVLRASLTARRAPERAAPVDEDAQRQPRTLAAERTWSREREAAHEIDRLAALPGGGLPVEPTRIPELPVRGALHGLPPMSPGQFTPESQASPIESSTADRDRPAARSLSAERNTSEPLPWQRPATAPPESHVAAPPAPAPDVEAKPPANGRQPAQLAKLTVLQLIDRLAKHEGASNRDIEREFIRRGFRARESQLAREFALADRATQREIVARLPRRVGIDARKWLHWFTQHPDAEIRLSAFQWLATSGDAIDRGELREALRHDPDLRIRALAKEISETQRR
ncbi:MAG: hypothetical protein DWQ35_11090 [Planctomycetota bacterium]|nr:MAG: hypothetical protein DWQ35_11090 [Planctomycetota bacterium]